MFFKNNVYCIHDFFTKIHQIVMANWTETACKVGY